MFGAGGDGSLDADAARLALAAVAASMHAAGVEPPAPERLADDFVRVACDTMARAIKRVSTQRGHDVSGHTLCCFGGAAGQHACLVADALGIGSVLLHPLAGVLSAYGMGLADVRTLRERTVELALNDDAVEAAEDSFAELGAAAVAELEAQGFAPGSVTVLRRAHVKYEGTDVALEVDWDERGRGADSPSAAAAARRAAALGAAFLALHERRYGFLMPARGLVLATVAVEAVGAGARAGEEGAIAPAREPEAGAVEADARGAPAAEAEAPGSAVPAADARGAAHAGAARGQTPAPVPRDVVSVFTAGAWRDTPVFERAALPAGTRLTGPAIVCEPTSTTVIEPGWEAEVLAAGELHLRRRSPAAPPSADPAERSPLLLEVFNNLFMSIAEQMGATLANTASSVNIKERLDFSCALFDGAGGLVANAPHLPVHLGSMGASVQAVIARHDGGFAPGDAYLLNSPYAGGTHLPDLTVITPVFADGASGETRTRAGQARALAEAPLFFVASRAHHADVGGITPGSMPPGSRTIDEEGVLVEDFRLVERGRLREAEVAGLLTSAPWPVRDLAQNLADLRAQVAANARGVAGLQRMVGEFGVPVVTAYMRHVQDNAEEAVRRAIARLRDGEWRQEMDDGSTIAVRVTVDRDSRSAIVDFSGTSPQRGDNFNAPAAVCTAAVLYVFRTLVDADIPLNAGCLKPLRIVVPPGSMLDPAYPAAVAAGNVETSQAITNALFGALGIVAASQGTMNNVTFGDARYQYYETICGGAGAGPGFDGCSAVHTHMTNSRLTDPEVLEARFPVRVEQFALRRGSGGEGAHRGGDGVVRRLRFLEPLTAAIVSSGRRVPPYGLAGGLPGAAGHNCVVRAGGEVEELPGVAQTEMQVGDSLVIETPGGGGFGAPPQPAS